MSEDVAPEIHAAIYARVSTDDQVQGTSLETQIEACQAYASSNGLVVWRSHIFVDGGVSGAILDRPALAMMREVIRGQAVQAVIVFALDRLSRILWHQSMLIDEWEKAGVRFHTVKERIEESPEGQLMRQVIGSFAEWERTKIRDRMLRGKRRLIEKGFPNSHTAPYGYRWTKTPHASTLVIDDTEAEVVRRIFRWALEGRTTRWIAMELTRERIPTRRATLNLGTKKTPPWCWNRTSVNRMLHYEGYLGRIYVGKELMVNGRSVPQPRDSWTKLSIPAMIDQETFDAVGERLALNQARARRNAKHTYLLSAATLRCGLCGGGMSGASHRRQRGDTYAYYLCNTHVSRMDRSHCRVFVPAHVIDPIAWAFVEAALDSPKIILEAIEVSQHGHVEQRLDAQRVVERFEQQIVRNGYEDARLIEAYQGGALTVEELKSRRQTLATEKQRLIDERWEAQEALTRLGAAPPQPYALDDYLSFVRQHLTHGSLAQRHWIIEQLRLVFTWTPGQPLAVHGAVPSATANAWCAYRTTIEMPPPRRAVVVPQIQAMRADGLTWRQIAATLTAEGVPPLAKGGPWSRSALLHLQQRYFPVPRRAPPDIAPALARIRQLRDAERLSFQRIANTLNAEGLPTLSGQPQWHYRAVYRFYRHYLAS